MDIMETFHRTHTEDVLLATPDVITDLTNNNNK